MVSIICLYLLSLIFSSLNHLPNKDPHLFVINTEKKSTAEQSCHNKIIQQILLAIKVTPSHLSSYMFIVLKGFKEKNQKITNKNYGNS